MTRTIKSISLILTALLILGLIFLPGIKRLTGLGSDKSQTEAPARVLPGQRQLSVNAELVQAHTMTDKTITTGNIIPSEEVDLSFETSGKVVAIYFKEGEYVRKGDLLAKINDKPLQAQLRKLEAQVPLAKDRVYRQETLLKKNAVSQEAYESVVTEFDKLKADIELVRANIAQTELYAPFDGIVGLRELSEGAFVSPSTNMAKLTQVNPLKIDFSIPESYASEVKDGTKIKFSLEDSEGIMRQYDARVYAVESTIDINTRTLKVRALYDNPDRTLMPGRFASVEITRREIKDALSVPSEAIIPEMGRNLVYLYRNGQAQPVEIISGIRTEARVQALSGIQEGDTLIISGVMQLRTGSKVIIDQIRQTK
ncbi:MAG: efflux RND transporter periplasmic adaptor subunit [Bacteroidales bacterium]|nr:efflux RND transporter periplasmic adaptor subunit [Bacteroidales bacterium]